MSGFVFEGGGTGSEGGLFAIGFGAKVFCGIDFCGTAIFSLDTVGTLAPIPFGFAINAGLLAPDFVFGFVTAGFTVGLAFASDFWGFLS